MQKIFHGKEEDICEKCELASKPDVNYVAPEKPKLIIIGESPGYQEVIESEPFVGKSGKWLNQALLRFGLSRDDVYITNAIKCYPSRGKDKIKIKLPLIDRCRKFLARELEYFPDVPVIVLGRIAVQAVTRYLFPPKGRDMREVYQKVLKTEDGRLFGFIYHPAYYMRQFGDADGASRFIKDFITVVGNLFEANPDINLNKPTTPFTIKHSFSEFIKACRVRQDGAILVFDLETNGKPVAAPDCKITCFGGAFIDDLKTIYTFFPTQEELGQVVEEISRFCLVAHNGKFDVNFLRRFTGVKLDIWFDTLLAAYVINQNRKNYALESLVYELAPDAALWKKQTKSKKQAKILEGDELSYYNAVDVYATGRLYQVLKDKVDEGRRKFLYWEILMPAQSFYAGIEFFGAYVDKDRLDYVASLCTRYLKSIESKLFSLPEVIEFEKKSNSKYNPASSQHNIKILQEIKKLKYYDPKKKKEIIVPGSGKDILKKFPDDEFCNLIIEWRKAAKLKSTYADGIGKKLLYDEETGLYKGYPSLYLHRTVTGRTSSGGLSIDAASPVKNKKDDLSFNFQNFPRLKLFRGIIVPPPGYVIVSFDYKTLEIVIAAALSREPVWVKALLEGLDFHSYMASLAFGVPYEEVKPKYKHLRQYAKTISFGLLYGGTHYLLMDRFGLSEEEAKKIYDAYFAKIETLRRWIDSVIEFIEKHGYVETPFGRRRYFDKDAIAKGSHRREGPNMIVQSVASDIMLLTARKIKSHMLELGWWEKEVKPFVTVHDSFSAYVKNEPQIIKKSIDIFTRCAMIEVMDFPEVKEVLGPLRLCVDFKIGTRWA